MFAREDQETSLGLSTFAITGKKQGPYIHSLLNSFILTLTHTHSTLSPQSTFTTTIACQDSAQSLLVFSILTRARTPFNLQRRANVHPATKKLQPNNLFATHAHTTGNGTVVMSSRLILKYCSPPVHPRGKLTLSLCARKNP